MSIDVSPFATVVVLHSFPDSVEVVGHGVTTGSALVKVVGQGAVSRDIQC